MYQISFNPCDDCDYRPTLTGFDNQCKICEFKQALFQCDLQATMINTSAAENAQLRAERDVLVENTNKLGDKIRELSCKLSRYTTAEAEGRLKWMPDTGIGDLSDGYHTFNELYHHRAVLFSVICNLYLSMAWKSKKHHDGTMFDGMFIVGINTPYGQATYHYDIEPYWDYFRCLERDFAPEWDGHTPEMAIERLLKFGNPAYAREAAAAALEKREK